MKPNLLLHLPENVENYVPLPKTSCVHYEYMNEQLRNLVHGTNFANLQIVSKVLAFISFENIKSKYLTNNSVAQNFCEGITKINMKKTLH